MTAAALPRDTTPFGAWERSVAMRYLRSRKAHAGVALISIISFVGILLAVAVLIIVMSVMNGFRIELLSRILGVEAHAYVYTSGLEDPAVNALEQLVAEVPGIVSTAAVLRGQGLATANGVFLPVMIIGQKPEDVRAIDFVYDSIIECRLCPPNAPDCGRCGSFEGFGEGRNGGDAIIIGRRMALQLGIGVGDEVTLATLTGGATVMGTTPRRKSYVVSATFEVGSDLYDAAMIYMPLDQARLFLDKRGETEHIAVRVENPDDIGDTVVELIDTVGGLGFVRDWRDQNQSFFNALVVERNVMRLILMLIVAIAAMNIISGLVMLVKNKGRDIAILRTMGATRGSIMRVFFLAGSSIGLSGTVAGLIVGVLFCMFIEPIQGFVEIFTGPLFPADVYQLSFLPAVLEWSEVALIAGWGLIMSCVATIFPAWRAAQLDPVEALRYE